VWLARASLPWWPSRCCALDTVEAVIRDAAYALIRQARRRDTRERSTGAACRDQRIGSWQEPTVGPIPVVEIAAVVA